MSIGISTITPPKKTVDKRFKVRKFSLGEEIHVDRDELYSERGN